MKPLTVCILVAAASPALAQAPQKSLSRADHIKNTDNRFTAIDTNHDGKITRQEMTAQQQRDLQQGKTTIQQQLQAKFKQLDTNKNGQLTLQEFMAATPTLRTAETPDQLIQRYDSNRDGKVTQEEFRAPEIAKFNKVDANRDGIVTPAEAAAAVKK